MDWLLHALGLCPDHMSHPNVLMAAGTATGGWFGLRYVWHKGKAAFGKADNQKAVETLKKIVESVQADRPRGWHIYPTELRDEAVGVLTDLGVEFKNYKECEATTKQMKFF